MTQSLVKITGLAQKWPQLTENKDAILLFKGQQDGDNSSTPSYFRVTVKKSTWNRIAKTVTDTTYYVIEGIPRASVTSKGTPFISVTCSSIHAINGLEEDPNCPGQFTFPGNIPEDTDEIVPISSITIPENLGRPKSAFTRAMNYFKKHKTFKTPLRIKKETMTLVSGYPEYLVAKELNIHSVPVSYNLLTGAPSKDEIKLNNINWYTPEEIKEINVDDIVLTEDVHLNTQNFIFKINLKEISRTRTITTPIAVRPLEDGKYALVTGAARYYAAKILDIQTIPAIITDLEHDEFIKERFMQYRIVVTDAKPGEIKRNKAARSVDGETPLDQIVIPEAFARTRPNPGKIHDTIRYYQQHGQFDKPVVIRGDNNLLVDGYKRYVAAKELGLETVWTRTLID